MVYRVMASSNTLSGWIWIFDTPGHDALAPQGQLHVEIESFHICCSSLIFCQ